MDEQSAKLVIAAGLLIGFLFWVVCVLMILKLRMQTQVETGEANLNKTSREEAIKKLLKAVTDPAQGAVGPSRSAIPPKVLERDDNSVKFELHRTVTSVQLCEVGSNVDVDYETDYSGLQNRYATILGIFGLLLMPGFIFGLTVLLWFLAVPSETPGVRGQVYQIFQIVHVLWPPFLIYWLYSRTRTIATRQIENIFVQMEVGSD